MGKYITVVIIVILTAILAGIFPYAQNINENKQSLIAALDTFYAADLETEEIAICYLGGPALFLRTLNHVVLIDPGDKINPSDIQGIKRLDLLLITQKIIADRDLEIVRRIYRRTNSTILANQVVYEELKDSIDPEKLRVVHLKETSSISDITVTAISSNGESDGWLLSFISIDSVRVFHGSTLNFTRDEASSIFSELQEAKTVDVAIIPAEGSSTENQQYSLKIISILRPLIVIAIKGSLDEQNILKNLIEQEYRSIAVLIPERLWIYELVAK